MKHRASLILASLLVAACSRIAEPPPIAVSDVNPGKVRAILLTADAAEAARCETELAASGAKVLYRNASGLLFADKPVADLKLPTCGATASENTTLALGPEPGGEETTRPDLPTLLRLIPAEEIGARSFVAANPKYDGRNVRVAILDTGVELDHPMLKLTPDGKDKIVAFEDLSGEGRVELAPVTVSPDGAFSAPSGTYSVKDVAGSSFQFGVFAGSTLAYAEEVSSQDKFTDVGVVTYLSDGKWRARIDTNADKAFTDETELYDFETSRALTKIGEKRSLTVSLNIGEGGRVVTLCFDDGSHGTHVAGITAGYESGGLQGVAPGAQVIAAKIGDNRLSGGSTTTASMLLAIDYAVAKKAHVINLSYGIRAGSNIGKSAIEAYVDKVAAEKGVLFSISAGNEGPGLLTVGTPAGAALAITNAAYVSKQTARDNYGYVGVENDNTWFFSSVGPRLDGGWKPTLLAPGTALASVPLWKGTTANYRGTSMASPHVTGGLALLLSAALQAGLPSSRAAITHAVYRSAVPVPSLAWIEQGHGLMNVPRALEALTAAKSETAIEYKIGANSATSPDGKGTGIYVRARQLPAEAFTVTVTPVFPPGTSASVQAQLRTFKLTPSASWIRVPGSLWMNASAKTFQVDLDPQVLATPGLRSEKITAIDERTGRVAFEVPVTVVSPLDLTDANGHARTITTPVKVGQTLRYFLNVPAGTTAITVELTTDGPGVWAQLLDPEGRKVLGLIDADKVAPQPPLRGQVTLTRAGVYELDIVAPPFNARPAQAQAVIRAYALQVVAGPFTVGGAYDALVTNDFAPVKITPAVEVRAGRKASVVEIAGNSTRLPFALTADDLKTLSKVRFTVTTAKAIYDLMTDYPYRVFDKGGKLVAAGGLELKSEIEIAELEKLTPGDFQLELQGAFTKDAPAKWAIELTEDRFLKTPIAVSTGKRVLVETGQTISVPVDLTSVKAPTLGPGFVACPTISLTGDRLIQETLLCR